MDLRIMELVQALHLLGRGVMDFFFVCCTFLGEETFLLVAVLGVYWCFSKPLGEQLLLSLFISLGANGLLKDLVRRPRPFLTPGFEERRYVIIRHFLVDTARLGNSFSFPSGHSQCAGAFFTSLALWSRRRKTAVLCGAAVLLVMISRVYLGVHFPTDVLVGGALGVGAAWAGWQLLEKFPRQKLWVFAGAAAMTALGLLVHPSPDTVKTVGVGVGALAGLWWEQGHPFSVEGTAFSRIIRLVTGGALLMALRMGLKLLLPPGLFFEGLRYACIGVTATGLWPWIFTKVQL